MISYTFRASAVTSKLGTSGYSGIGQPPTFNHGLYHQFKGGTGPNVIVPAPCLLSISDKSVMVSMPSDLTCRENRPETMITRSEVTA